MDAMKRKDGAILDARKKVSSSSSSSRAKSSPRSLEDWNEKSTISKTAKGERANALKEEGNELFKRGDLKKAEEKYSESLDIEQNNAFVLSNRAIVRLKLGKLEACVNDCEKSLEILKTGDDDDDDDDDTNILIVKREEERESCCCFCISFKVGFVVVSSSSSFSISLRSMTTKSLTRYSFFSGANDFPAFEFICDNIQRIFSFFSSFSIALVLCSLNVCDSVYRRR